MSCAAIDNTSRAKKCLAAAGSSDYSDVMDVCMY